MLRVNSKMSKDAYYRFDLDESKKLIPSLTENQKIYSKLFSVYEKFISSELPKISTDFEIEGNGNDFLLRTVIDGIINTINTYPHPQKNKMIYISVNGSEKSVSKIKNILETLLVEEGKRE